MKANESELYSFGQCLKIFFFFFQLKPKIHQTQTAKHDKKRSVKTRRTVIVRQGLNLTGTLENEALLPLIFTVLH